MILQYCPYQYQGCIQTPEVEMAKLMNLSLSRVSLPTR